MMNPDQLTAAHLTLDELAHSMPAGITLVRNPRRFDPQITVGLHYDETAQILQGPYTWARIRQTMADAGFVPVPSAQGLFSQSFEVAK